MHGTTTIRPPAGVAAILSGANSKNVVAGWDAAHRLTPAPRHRRRLILRWLDGIDFTDCLDAGCAQPYLLHEIVRRRRARGATVAGFGCDISDEIVRRGAGDPLGCQFFEVDLTRGGWPGGRRFDLVVCSEVLEHIADWRIALAHLARMTRRHLLITVPSGPIRMMDRMVGHRQHFAGPEMVAAIEAQGLKLVRRRHWGFPMHSLYKAAISGVAPDRLYQSFSGGDTYSLPMRLISHGLYGSFFLNDPFNRGMQFMALAERR